MLRSGSPAIISDWRLSKFFLAWLCKALKTRDPILGTTVGKSSTSTSMGDLGVFREDDLSEDATTAAMPGRISLFSCHEEDASLSSANMADSSFGLVEEEKSGIVAVRSDVPGEVLLDWRDEGDLQGGAAL
eukprot:CCRYP_002666-RB/>CCRYP_002666-RB protein AED:0.43 eAED:1.00 QI:0/0/0/1/0/0/2/0/130